jgi:hypothetical protein
MTDILFAGKREVRFIKSIEEDLHSEIGGKFRLVIAMFFTLSLLFTVIFLVDSGPQETLDYLAISLKVLTPIFFLIGLGILITSYYRKKAKTTISSEGVQCGVLKARWDEVISYKALPRQKAFVIYLKPGNKQGSLTFNVEEDDYKKVDNILETHLPKEPPVAAAEKQTRIPAAVRSLLGGSVILLAVLALYMMSKSSGTPMTCILEGYRSPLKEADCYFKFALKRNNTVLCGKINDRRQRDDCYYKVGQKTGRYYCNPIEDKTIKDSCYEENAEKLKNIALCDPIQVYQVKKICYEKTGFNTSVCDEIEKGDQHLMTCLQIAEKFPGTNCQKEYEDYMAKFNQREKWYCKGPFITNIGENMMYIIE